MVLLGGQRGPLRGQRGPLRGQRGPLGLHDLLLQFGLHAVKPSACRPGGELQRVRVLTHSFHTMPILFIPLPKKQQQQQQENPDPDHNCYRKQKPLIGRKELRSAPPQPGTVHIWSGTRRVCTRAATPPTGGARMAEACEGLQSPGSRAKKRPRVQNHAKARIQNDAEAPCEVGEGSP